MSMQPFRVGLISRTFYYLPVWAAEEQGYFQQEGLAPTLSFIGNDAQCELLLDGQLDVAIAPPEGVLQNAMAGGALRIAAGNSGKLSHQLIVQPHIQCVEDLRGKVIGILSQTEGSFFHFQELAEAHGLHYPRDYAVQTTGGAPARHIALQHGTIDAGLQSVPWSYAAQDLGFNTLADIDAYVPDWQFNTVNVEIRRAARHRPLYVAFLHALQRGVDWVYAAPAEACALAARQMGIRADYAARAWRYFTEKGRLTRDMGINFPGLRCVAEAQIKAGLLPPAAGHALARCVDLSLLHEAQAASPPDAHA
jgi:ABC-type nitrate/sulfonate/bicarbonate transport system substrate-binding protein